MRAIQVSAPGDAQALVLREISTPRPAPGEVLIQVVISGVNFIDIYVREGRYNNTFPLVPGQEAAGVVVETGEGVSGFVPGDRVAWCSIVGTYAEYAVAPASRVVKVPDEISLAKAAAVLLQGMTAHYLTRSLYEVRQGDEVLIHAGAGGVGLLLTQLAKQIGAHVVTTVSSERKAVISKDAGADETIRYGAEGETSPYAKYHGKMHVVYDSVGRSTFHDSLACLRDRGVLALYGTASGPVPEFNIEQLARGSYFITRPILKHYTATKEELDWRAAAVFRAVADETIQVLIGKVYPLEDAALAHADMESRRSFGKLLLEIRPE